MIAAKAAGFLVIWRDLLLHAVAHSDEDAVRRAAARLVDDWAGTSDELLGAARADAPP